MNKKYCVQRVILFTLLLLVCLTGGCSSKKEGGTELTCTISISCETLLDNPDLASEKKDLVPEDGFLLKERVVSVQEGESVFDVLYRVTREEKIHMEYEKTPAYNSVYIEGIGNLYEFDGGPRSGWMYRMNGEFPNYGCSAVLVEDGDLIEWVYTCDLGKDVGCEEGFNEP